MLYAINSNQLYL